MFPKTFTFLFVLLALCVANLTAQGGEYIDGNPPNWCRGGLFTNQNVDFEIARVIGKKNSRAYFYDDSDNCPVRGKCRRRAYVIAGDEMVVSRTYGNFVCAWYQPRKGHETVGWIRASQLSFPSDVSLKYDWLGEWIYAENNIVISKTGAEGTYLIKGIALWMGFGDNVHIGELDYNGSPERNMLEIGSGEDKYDCRVKMYRLGRFLIVSDNKNCGGVNVSFDGVYRRN